ncbi:uncharacterized protein MYCGRDRAFT_94499 [Zymoseptoria tritici IPO323]|uniref:CBM20 domain-containing protein n=1 Tax=Zymoseptoria tritici (strain CBS 115943 / IPO323) TaxID=336722 RepID=F9XFV9_ZYMTI|nr:uncharacterized protein MYCGRDRAFT_94499 [Zymoseptoria tritici IPO323]EGP86112.1 hypothetical protein MYCGRDRAFT_94499 [Zymoseptoria tritici IPO323]
MTMDWRKSTAVLGFLSTLASAQTTRVVTVAVYQCSGSTVGFPSTISYATNPASSAATPYTTTIAPSGTNPGSVVVVTPSGYTGTLPPYTTVYGSYSGVSVLTEDFTYSTAFPAGASQGVYYVYRPPQRYVTLTEYQTGGTAYTSVVTRTVPPSGTMPGYYIIQTPSPTSNPGNPPAYTAPTNSMSSSMNTPPTGPVSSTTSPGAPPAYTDPAMSSMASMMSSVSSSSSMMSAPAPPAYTDPAMSSMASSMSSSMSSMMSSMTSAAPSGVGPPPSYDALPPCGEPTCEVGATNSTLCNSEYGNAFNTTCGVVYTGRTPKRATTDSASACARECDLTPGCVAYNYMADMDVDNCEILDQVTGSEPSDGSVGGTRPTENPKPVNSTPPSYSSAGEPPQYTVPQSPSTTSMSPLATITPSMPMSTGGSMTPGLNLTTLLPSYIFPGESPSRSSSESAVETVEIPSTYSEPSQSGVLPPLYSAPSSSMMISSMSPSETIPYITSEGPIFEPTPSSSSMMMSSVETTATTISGILPPLYSEPAVSSSSMMMSSATSSGSTATTISGILPPLYSEPAAVSSSGNGAPPAYTGPPTVSSSTSTASSTSSSTSRGNGAPPEYTGPPTSTYRAPTTTTTTTGAPNGPPPAYTGPITTTTTRPFTTTTTTAPGYVEPTPEFTRPEPAGTSISTTTTESCASTPSLTSVTFRERIVTVFGESVNIFGSIEQLATWNVDNAPALSSANYTDPDPIWFYTVSLPVALSFEYKYYRRYTNGSIQYEADPNRVYTVPGNCAGAVTVNDVFRPDAEETGGEEEQVD